MHVCMHVCMYVCVCVLPPQKLESLVHCHNVPLHVCNILPFRLCVCAAVSLKKNERGHWFGLASQDMFDKDLDRVSITSIPVFSFLLARIHIYIYSYIHVYIYIHMYICV